MSVLRCCLLWVVAAALACDDDPDEPADTADSSGDTADAVLDSTADGPSDSGDMAADLPADADADAIHEDAGDALTDPDLSIDEGDSDVLADAPAPDAVDLEEDVEIPPPPDCGDGLLITRQASDGDVSFRLDRCMPQICGGGCPVSSPQLILVSAGHTDVASSDVIEYTQTHHNWLDSLVATLPDRRLLWRVEFEFTDGLVEEHYLAIESLDGDPILRETLFEISP